MEFNDDEQTEAAVEEDLEGKDAEKGAEPEDSENAAPEKPKRTPEEELEYHEARAKRLRKKLGKDAAAVETPAPHQKPSELDYGQLAFLTAKGIESEDEVALAQTFMKETGKSLKDVVSSRFFQAELKDLQDQKTVKDAIPSSSKRSGQSGKDSVEYWIAKGELPPADQRELRIKVVNAKKARAKGNGQFYNS